MEPILVDFMKYDEQSRLMLTCVGTHRDLEKAQITLVDGLKLVFYDDDQDDEGNTDNLVVEGIVEFDIDNSRWAARIDWDEIKNISKLTPEEKERLGLA